jgi:hypothetical protein
VILPRRLFLEGLLGASLLPFTGCHAEEPSTKPMKKGLFRAEPGVVTPASTSFSSTAGRWRLERTGFVPCAASEERLCYDSFGTFLGWLLQGADTYHSARWHDHYAPHGSADAAFLAHAPNAGSVAYAGSHRRPDLFGGTGGGAVLTQGTDLNGCFEAANLMVDVARDDVVRVHAMVSVLAGSREGTIQLRAFGGMTGAVSFSHDLEGTIVGMNENWRSFRSGFHNLEILNGRRWVYLWLDGVASNDAVCSPAIGFGEAGQGRELHVCELMIQKNPASAPAAVPVCAERRSFDADTIYTGLRDATGYIMPGLAIARSRMPSGRIEGPALPVGLPYLPVEKEIRLVRSNEAEDRTGILHNENSAHYLRPWRKPATHVACLGPGSFPEPIVFDGTAACGDYTLSPVFRSRADLAPIVARVVGNSRQITGKFAADGCVFLALTDTVETFTQQTDIRSGPRAQQFLAAGTVVSARDCLVLGCPVTHTRARREVQIDDTDEQRIFVGEFYCAVSSGTVDVSGSRFERLARGPFVAAETPESLITFHCDDTYFDLIWSDHVYPHKGRFEAPTGSRRFHGRVTAKATSFWQSRKAIEVDLRDGRGWRDLPASGLKEGDLPPGRRATYVGHYDFAHDRLTPASDAAHSMIVRFWYRQGTGVADMPGYQWHASQVHCGDYERYPESGSVWLIETENMRLRLYVDAGHYDAATKAWVAGEAGAPAQPHTGTHCDNFQVNTAGLEWDGFVADDVFMFNDAQGPYITGTTRAAIGSMFMRNHIVVTSVFNATLLGSGGSLRHCEVALSDWLVAQRQSPFRLGDGSAERTRFSFSGANTRVSLHNVTVATSNGSDIANGGALVTGQTRHLRVPLVENYGEVVPAEGGPSIADLVDGHFLDARYGVIRSDVQPRELRFTQRGEALTGMPLNAIIEKTIGNHPRWDAVLAEIIKVYFKAPTITLQIPAAAQPGSVIDLKGLIGADAFHATHGNHRSGHFKLDGKGNLAVTRPLTGIDAVWLLRTDRDETILLDIR